MPDDWNTMNIKGGTSPGTDVEALRARYVQHRAVLTKLAAEAPTQQLAQAYLRLRSEIETALGKLNAIDGKPEAHEGFPIDSTAPPEDDPFGTMSHRSDAPALSIPPVERSGPRLVLLGLIGLAGVLLFAYFVYQYATTDEGRGTARIVEETSPPLAPTPVPTPTPAPGLSADIKSYDFEIVAKGTRKTKNFELTNATTSAMPLKVGRSTCRCLWFSFPPTLPPGGKGTLTVTIDGARAPAGKVNETVRLSAGHDESINTTIEITGEVK